jgi:type VI secretion system protein ImpE
MLFVLLCYAGEFERADKQLDVLATQDEQSRTGTLIYHNLLSSEWERRKVYEGSSKPTLPLDPPRHTELRVKALQNLREGNQAEAEALIDEAGEISPTCRGKLNGEAFEGLRDYDDMLGDVLEIFASGRYIWMPLCRIRNIQFTEPETAIDTLWRQAQLEGTDGEVAEVHLPVLYQPSYANEHDAIRLGRMTDWTERGELYTGLGQHLFLAMRDGERFEESLLDFRSIELESES